MEEYRVLVMHNAHEAPEFINFKVVIESPEVGILKAFEFQQKSFDVGMYQVRWFKEEYMQKDEVKIGLKALELGKLWGIEVDFSKGIECFLSNLYKRHDTNDLKHELEQLERLPMKSSIVHDAIEKELKSRGEM